MAKLSKEDMDFLNENPTGSIEDLPDVLKQMVKSTAKKVEKLIDDNDEIQQKRD